MNLTKWTKRQDDPFRDFFDFPDWGLTMLPRFAPIKEGWIPAIDVDETDKEIRVKADLPGLTKEDIQISVDGSVLTIKGERKTEEEKNEKGYRRIERSYGRFERSFDLGVHVDESKVKAAYKDGVLTLNIPKNETKQLKRITIE